MRQPLPGRIVFTIASLAGRLNTVGDPWLGMNDDPQSLEPLLAMSERDLATGLMDAPWAPVYPKHPIAMTVEVQEIDPEMTFRRNTLREQAQSAA